MTEKCRLYIKSKNTYHIIRECFNAEKDPRTKDAEYKLIMLLIADEPAEGMKDLSEVEIPDEILKQLEESRAEDEKEIQAEEEQQKSKDIESL